ncbi:unnamed protein product, partial [marine sediment metagenome]
PFLLLPIIVLGGIYTGFFTPTEAATVACFLAIILGAGVYRGFTWQNFWSAVVSAAKVGGVIYILLSGVQLFSFVIHRSGLATAVTDFMIGGGFTPFTFIIVMMAIYIILGFVIPPLATMVALVPLVLPAAEAFGINLYWFGCLWTIANVVGTLTPPFAFAIFVSVRILGVPFHEIVRGIIPLFPVVLGTLILVIFVPEVALWLPNTMRMA